MIGTSSCTLILGINGLSTLFSFLNSTQSFIQSKKISFRGYCSMHRGLALIPKKNLNVEVDQAFAIEFIYIVFLFSFSQQCMIISTTLCEFVAFLPCFLIIMFLKFSSSFILSICSVYNKLRLG